MSPVQRPDAMTVALRLLSRRAASEAGMRRVLQDRGIPPTEIRRVLGRLRRLGYIHDQKFAADWSERLQERGFGSLRIRHRLRKDGIEEGLADRVVPAARDERVTAKAALQARFGQDPPSDPRTRSRAYRFLLSRGFPSEVVESVLGLWEE